MSDIGPVVQRPTFVRLPAVADAICDALGGVAARFVASMACRGCAHAVAVAAALWESLQVFAGQASDTGVGGHERYSGAVRCTGC